MHKKSPADTAGDQIILRSRWLIGFSVELVDGVFRQERGCMLNGFFKDWLLAVFASDQDFKTGSLVLFRLYIREPGTKGWQKPKNSFFNG